MSSRHLPIWGEKRLEILKSSHVLIAGVGGLGGFVAEQLVRCGIGTLSLLDKGIVDLSDMNRQTLYTTLDIGRYKAKAAAERLYSMVDPEAGGEGVSIRISRDIIGTTEAEDWIKSQSVTAFADCLDNYEARFALEDCLVKLNDMNGLNAQSPGSGKGKMFMVHGGIQGLYGQVTTLVPGVTKMLKDIYPGRDAGLFTDYVIPVCQQICAVTASIMSLAIMHNIWMQHMPEDLAYKDLPAAQSKTLRGILKIVDLNFGELRTVELK